MESQKCKKCNIEKPLAEFSKHANYKSGVRTTCRSCASILMKEWKKNNPNKVKEGKKRWQKSSKERFENAFGTKVCGKCNLEKPLSDFYSHSGSKCKECEKTRMKEYRENHPTKRKETKAKWNSNNIEWVKNNKKEYVKRRAKKDPVYRAMKSMRFRTTMYGKRKFDEKRGRFTEIIGIDPQGFRDYISSKFEEGMSWENYGWSTWHIDHIIPLSSAKTIKELEELSHHTNLQPLWKDENLEKSNKIL